MIGGQHATWGVILRMVCSVDVGRITFAHVVSIVFIVCQMFLVSSTQES